MIRAYSSRSPTAVNSIEDINVRLSKLLTRGGAVLLSLAISVVSASAEESNQSQQTPPTTDLFIYGAPFQAPLVEVPQSTTVVTEQRL
jgi:hypothetical protein